MARALRGSKPDKTAKRTKGKHPDPSPAADDMLREDRKPRFATFEPRSDMQARYAQAIDSSDLVFGIGPAGTGKTWVPAAKAAEAFKAREVDRIIITRPAVEAGAKLGFLPGDLNEKFDPYFRPFRAALEAYLGAGAVEGLIKAGRIEAMPLAYMRGHTFENAFVILDEAQNTTPVEMKLFLTRLGEDSICVVTGDPRQKDIPGPCGLIDAIEKLRGLRRVSLIEFSREDIVRSGLVQRIVERYEGEEDFNPASGLQRMLDV